jgi:hypothetical protein
MMSCYEEAVQRMEHPKNTHVRMGYYKPYEDPHAIIYEWKLNREQWHETTEPIKKIYKKDFTIYFTFFMFCYFACPIIAIIIAGDFYVLQAGNFKDYWRLVLYATPLLLPIITIIIAGTIRGYKRMREPYDKRVLFMTPRGVFNGRVYTTRIWEYQINEKKNMFNLLISQCNMFNLTRGGQGILSGTGGRKHTFWNNFIYNDADKIRIFVILELWEKYKTIKPKDQKQRVLLQNYLLNQSAEEVEKIRKEYMEIFEKDEERWQYWIEHCPPLGWGDKHILFTKDQYKMIEELY